MSLAVSGNYYGAGAGTDAYTGTFIPTIWSGKLQVKFYLATVFGEIANTDYEGEIKDMGDKVNIRTIPSITVSTYQKGLNLATQVPTNSIITLNINQGKYFNVLVDDVDAVQADIRLMDVFTNDATEQMKIAIDSTVLGGVPASAAAANQGLTAGAISANINLGVAGTPLLVTKINVLDVLVDVGQVLDEQNVPETGRWIVIPPWMAGLIKKSDLKDAAITGDSVSPARNGRLGMIDRFTIYVSNNLTHAVDGSFGQAFSAVAGTKDAITFASQVTKMETLRSTTTFGNIVRGLNVFGYLVAKPEALAFVYVAKG
jgi:hypothetical protein